MHKIVAHHHLKLLVVVPLFGAAVLLAYLVTISDGSRSPVVSAGSCTPDAKLVNPCRPWYGAAVNRYPQVGSGIRAQMEYHEQRMGRKLDIVHTYHPVGNNQLNADEVYFANRAGTMLFTNWKPAASWASAAGGNATVNATIDKMGNSIKALGSKKIFLTVYHEPENDVSSGGQGCSSTIRYVGSAGTPADYRAMWQNVRNRFNNLGVSNVVWVMDYMNYTPWDCLVDDLYPGNGLVDWVMFNAYGGGKAANYSTNVRHFYNLLTSTNSTSHNYLSKTWGIVEWNIRGATASQEYSYYDQAKTSLEADEFPKLKAYMVFDSVGPDGNENRVAYLDNGTYDATKQAHYKAFANSSVFTGTTTTPPSSLDTTAPTASISTPAYGATLNGKVTVAASATDDTGIAKVVFTIDGNVIGTDTSTPYSVVWDTRQVGDGSHVIRAKAYDIAGNTKTPQKSVTVKNGTVAPPAPRITAFKASPATLTVGGRTTLSWSVLNVAACSVGPDGPQNATSTTWTTPAYVSVGTKHYTLTCRNTAFQSVTASLTVTVNAPTAPPAKPSLSADRAEVSPGVGVLLSWSAAGATGCVLNPGNVAGTGSSGSKLTSNLRQTTTFTLDCSNSAGKTSADPVTVRVVSSVQATTPSITSFTADPAALPGVGVSTLTWTTENVATNGCRLSPSPLSSAAMSGRWTTPPLTISTSFTLTCKDAANHSASQSLGVSVRRTAAPTAPAADPMTGAPTSEAIIDSIAGPVVNAQVDDTVVQGELVSLDPSNILDAQKIQRILRVEYYDGERLLQTVAAPPYALATKTLKPGAYTLTERVYYQDGSQSERTQNVTITPKEAAAAGVSVIVAAVSGVGGAGVVGAGLFFGRQWWLPRARLWWALVKRALAYL